MVSGTFCQDGFSGVSFRKKLTWLAGKDRNSGLKELAHAERGGRWPEARDVCWSETTHYTDVPG